MGHRRWDKGEPALWRKLSKEEGGEGGDFLGDQRSREGVRDTSAVETGGGKGAVRGRQGGRGGFLAAFTLELRRCVREGGPNEHQRQTLTRTAEEGDTSQNCCCSVRVRE